MNNKEQAQQAAEEKYPLMTIEEFNNSDLGAYIENEPPYRYEEYKIDVNCDRAAFLAGAQWQSSQTPDALPYAEVIETIKGCNNGMVEYFQRHDYRLMYDMWTKIMDVINTAQRPMSNALPVVSGGEKMYRWVKYPENKPDKEGYYIAKSSHPSTSPMLPIDRSDTYFRNDQWDSGEWEVYEWLEEVSPSQLKDAIDQWQTLSPKNNTPVRSAEEVKSLAMDFVEDLSTQSQTNRTDLHFNEENLVKWLCDFANQFKGTTPAVQDTGE